MTLDEMEREKGGSWRMGRMRGVKRGPSRGCVCLCVCVCERESVKCSGQVEKNLAQL